MNIDHLKEFIYLAETLNFSATAKHFFVSPSVLSKHVAAMESELSAKLLERDSHSVRLTEAGEIFLEDAQTIVVTYAHSLERIAALDQDCKAVVRVGYMRNAARPFLFMFMRYMRAHHPEVQITPVCMEYGELYYALGAGKVDMGFGLDAKFGNAAAFASIPIYPDRFDVVVSLDHPLAKRVGEGIAVADLSEVNLMLPNPDSYPGMSEFVEGILPEGCTGRKSYYRDIDTAYMSVELGMVAVFSSEHNMEVFGDQVRFVRINDADTAYHVSAFWPRNTKNEAIDVCVEAVEHCRDKLAQKRAAKASSGDSQVV